MNLNPKMMKDFDKLVKDWETLKARKDPASLKNLIGDFEICYKELKNVKF